MFNLFVAQLQHVTSKVASTRSIAESLLFNLAATKAFSQCLDIDKDIIPKVFNQIFDSIRMEHASDIKESLEEILHTIIVQANTDELDTEVGGFSFPCNCSNTVPKFTLFWGCSTKARSTLTRPLSTPYAPACRPPSSGY
jgi:hypothetical protein